MADPNDIIDACKQLLTVAGNAGERNKFVIAVAAKSGVILNGIADQIMGQITSK